MLRICSLLSVATLIITITSQAQNIEAEDPIEIIDYAVEYATTINASELEEHLMIIASDEFEGRETGMPGQKKAAEYIANYFEGLQIDPYDGKTYFQEYPLKRELFTSTTCTVEDQQFKFIKDFYFFGSGVSEDLALNEITVAGYGIGSNEWNDYSETEVKGKYVLILSGAPMKKGKLLVESEEMKMWAADWRLKTEELKARGAKGVLIINEQYESYMSRVKYYLENPGMSLLEEEVSNNNEVFQTMFISPFMANAILSNSKNKNLKKLKKRLNKKKKVKEKTVELDLKLNLENTVENFTGENVLAFIEGTDLKDEVVVVTAHYDHIGRDGDDINNGADDDGSGTVSALEIAEAFQMAKLQGNGPRRSVLVMTVSGEEKGLLGSRYYADNPIYPLENTVANLNIDMIGRVDEAHKDSADYIYLIGSDKLSTDLHNISEKANSDYINLELDYTFNDPNDPNKFYYRSDHYNFAKNGIPVIFYFSGVHEDYHKPTDTPDKIMYNKLEKVARLVFHTAWELANRDEAPVVDKENEFTD
ncbi:MAG: M28 family peptidase [Flavobacteriales bacterium]